MLRLWIVTAGVCVAVATTCTPCVHAQPQPQPYIEANVVASDARETRGFIDALDHFDVTLDQAQRKATLSEVELRAVQAEADRLKALVLDVATIIEVKDRITPAPPARAS